MLSAVCLNLDQSKILSSGVGLNIDEYKAFVDYRLKIKCCTYVEFFSFAHYKATNFRLSTN